MMIGHQGVDHKMLVRHEGANYQLVKVPSGKLAVHPDTVLLHRHKMCISECALPDLLKNGRTKIRRNFAQLFLPRP